MATNLQSQSYVLSVLAGGQNPGRGENPVLDPTQPPPIASGGPSLASGATPGIIAVLDVALAEDPWRRTARITLPTYDDTADLIYEQGGASASYTCSPGDSQADSLDGWVADINASAIPCVAERVGLSVVVRQDVGTYEPVSVTATQGAAAVVLDADSCQLDLYARTRNAGTPAATALSVSSAAWRRYVSPGQDAPASMLLDRGGVSMQLAVGPYESIWPYVSSVAGVALDGATGNATQSYAVRAWVAPTLILGSV